MTEAEAFNAAQKIIAKYPTEADLLTAELQYVSNHPPREISEGQITNESDAKNQLEKYRRIAASYQTEDLRQMLDFDSSNPGFYSPMIMYVTAEEYIKRFPHPENNENK